MTGIKKILLKIDPWLGTKIKLKTESYTKDPNLLSGEGVYKAGDWSLTREKNSKIVNKCIYENNNTYLQYIFSQENSKISAGISLANHFDFTRYHGVLEIGSGSMIQAFVIKNMFGHLRYLATDYDQYVINKCSTLTALENIEKKVLDISNISTEKIPEGIDLIMSWAVDYAIKDEYLLSLLTIAKKQHIAYLMCSPSIIGIVQYLNIIRNKPNYIKLIKSGKIRMHGWNRSVGYFKRLANKAKMDTHIVGKHGSYFCVLFKP